jgi:hypothetical protein
VTARIARPAAKRRIGLVGRVVRAEDRAMGRLVIVGLASLVAFCLAACGGGDQSPAARFPAEGGDAAASSSDGQDAALEVSGAGDAAPSADAPTGDDGPPASDAPASDGGAPEHATCSAPGDSCCIGGTEMLFCLGTLECVNAHCETCGGAGQACCAPLKCNDGLACSLVSGGPLQGTCSAPATP